MKTLLSILAVVMTLGFGLGAEDAEAARRLGGGKSSGMQRQTTTANKAADAKPAQTPAAPAAAAQSQRSWMGPLAGLAAGLGLAALASHFGFGQELASMMMIGLVIMAVLVVVGLIMRKRAGAQQPLTAGVAGMRYAGVGMDRPGASQTSYDVSMPGSTIGTQLGATSSVTANFDVAGFERNARVQFLRLQTANDAGNLDDIREFTTPEMFAEIRLDMSERGGATQETEVIKVEAKVIEMVEEGALYVVSLRFTGMIRESKVAQPQAFEETWHLVKAREGSGGWLLSGIQQMQSP